jgi:protein-ribulosamine 3-kinase
MKATPFTRHLESLLSAHYAEEVKITGAEMAHGGSINESYRLSTSHGFFFLKRNDAVEYPGMFTEEAKGLNALRDSTSLKIPAIITLGHFKSHAFLLLEHLEKANATNSNWEKLGEGLAEVHRKSGEHYGWESDNYIGSLEQKNQRSSSWPEFLIQRRLEPMAIKALTEKKIDRKLYEKLQALYPKLEHLFPVELPTLVHGDLWSGNFLPLAEGQCALLIRQCIMVTAKWI